MTQLLGPELDVWEALAKALDPDPKEFENWMTQLTRYGTDFLTSLPHDPAFAPVHSVASGKPAPDERPQPLAAVLKEYHSLVRSNGLEPASGRFFGYIPGGGLPASAVGDFVAALTNPYSGAYAACPGAADIENQVVGWLRDLLGFPAESWGTLQSGGSLATLTALVAARSRLPFDRWAKSVIYHSTETHYCFQKSIRVAGLEICPRREIPVDSQFRMSLPALEKQLAEDRKAGLQPWLLCANAGTTNTGAVDPLLELSEICRRETMWYHVDAAYGGFFYLVPSARGCLQGMTVADSVVLDPHKGLFQPYGCGAVVVRDAAGLRSAMSYDPEYLRDVSDARSPSPMDYSPELSRHFRAARLWFSLKMNGLERFRGALEEKLALARYAHEELQGVGGVTVGPEPQLTVVTFRVHGTGATADEATSRLHQTLLQRGRVHLSSTRLMGQIYLRMCILNFRSHRAEVDAAIDEIRAHL